jgi:predicted carbohydrate-binding protein with CBM5 and CBM33 domain
MFRTTFSTTFNRAINTTINTTFRTTFRSPCAQSCANVKPAPTALMPTVILGIVVANAAFPTNTACAHGSMADPPSRVYKIFQDNPQTPQSPAAAAAIAVGGTQPFYDWHEVSRNIPSHNYSGEIPDGQLAGAGRDKYAGLNLARTDWYATPITAGPRVCRFCATTPHDPSSFLAYMTKSGYDPRQPLKWSDLEPIAGGDTATLTGSCGKSGKECHCGAGGAPMHYVMTLDIPERVGRHVLFVIWQRDDPAGEAFFSASDVDFGGVDYGEKGEGDDPALVPLATNFEYTSTWTGGGQAEFTITNTSVAAIRGWSVQFNWLASINSLWNGSFTREGDAYSVNNAAWNQELAPGASVSFGCTVQSSSVSTPPTNLVAWGRLPPGAAPCPADANGDRTVDAADLGLLLANWGEPSGTDLNGDGTTDAADLSAMLAAWGACE